MRSQYLGPGWDLAYVRGTPYNTGDCLEMATSRCEREASRSLVGMPCDVLGCECAFGYGRSGLLAMSSPNPGYPLGVMINADGERFVDEGIDFRNYTYAIFGRQILAAAWRRGVASLGPADDTLAAERRVSGSGGEENPR